MTIYDRFMTPDCIVSPSTSEALVGLTGLEIETA